MTRPGMAMTLTECAGDRYLDTVARWRECFDYSKDAFGIVTRMQATHQLEAPPPEDPQS